MKITTQFYEEYLANLIATRWLAFAEQAIIEGHNPVKLSDSVESSVIGLYEGNNALSGKKFNKARNTRIAKHAIVIATRYLENGHHPIVLNHFRAQVGR